jgi:hypothetical protein
MLSFSQSDLLMATTMMETMAMTKDDADEASEKQK